MYHVVLTMGKPLSTFVFVLHLVLQEGAFQVTLANNAANCKEVYLVTVENKTIGIKVSIISQNGISGGVTAYQPPQLQKIETKTINGYFLSPECGTNFFRCSDLMVVSSTLNQTATQHIVLVPLANGILLLDLNYNGSSLLFSSHHVIPIEIGCSPTAVVRILSGMYAICMNSKAGHLSAVQIYLNETVLTNTFISSAIVHMDFSGLNADLTTVTNFVHASLDDDVTSQFVYFSVAGFLYALVPPEYISHDVGQLAHCTHADKLVYAGGHTLIAYCRNNSVVNFDINFEDWINQTSYMETGKPYVCPNQNVHLSVFSGASYIQYGLWSENTLENFNIPGLKFTSGVCFGKQNKTFFAYNDREDGVYVLEPTTSSLHRLSRSDSSVCEPVMAIENRYLIFQEKQLGDSTIIVVDSQENFSTLIEGQHIRADLVTLVQDIDLKCATERIPDIDIVVNDNQIPTETAEKSSHSALIILTTTLPTAIAAVVVVALLCAILMVYKRKKRLRGRLERPIRQATTSNKDDASYTYHPPSTNRAYPAMSRDTVNSPVFATIVQCQTHVYGEQQNKAVSQAATQEYAETRTKTQKTTTRNGLTASLSAAGLQTTATAGKHDWGINLSGAGELGSAAKVADGAVENILVTKSKLNEKSAEETEMKMVKPSCVETSSSVDSATMRDESFSTLPVQEVSRRGSSSTVEDLELGGDYNQDTDPLLPDED